MRQEFIKFIARGNVIDLAVGIIMGAAFTAIVNSLVNDIIMPPIGVVLGGVDFSNIFITLSRGQSYPSLAAAQQAGAATLNIGVFINAVIKFLIVAGAVFILVKQVNALQARLVGEKEKGPPPPPSKQEVLLEQIRDLLKSR